MLRKASICLFLGTGLLILPRALPASFAQTHPDSVEAQDGVQCERCPATYPREASLSGLEGTVGLVINIDADGRVTSVRLTRSSGYRLLDQSALETAPTWRFSPMADSLREVYIEIDYRIDDGSGEL